MCTNLCSQFSICLKISPRHSNRDRGAFGGKEDYPSTLAAMRLAGYEEPPPCEMVYDRMEDLAATTKRHPSRTRHRTALDRDGRLLAMDIDLATDGARTQPSRRLCSRAPRFMRGTVRVPQRTRAIACVGHQHVPYGAFRGFGAPQAIFAVERHMDEIAAAIGMDPTELRRRNFFTTATQPQPSR